MHDPDDDAADNDDDEPTRYLDDRATRVIVYLIVGATVVFGATGLLIAYHH